MTAEQSPAGQAGSEQAGVQREIHIGVCLVVYPDGRISTRLEASSHRLDDTEETTRRVDLAQPIVRKHVLALASELGCAITGEEMAVVTSPEAEISTALASPSVASTGRA